jgi:hypothetical protein
MNLAAAANADESMPVGPMRFGPGIEKNGKVSAM